MASHWHSHDSVTLNLLVVLVDSVAYFGTNSEVLFILLLLILGSIDDASFFCLFQESGFQTCPLDTSLVLLLDVLLLLLGVRIDQLFDLLFALKENAEIIFSIVDHVLQLEMNQYLLVNLMQFV